MFFYFELSAIRMEVKTDQSSIAHLLTSLMAIIGGVFAVSLSICLWTSATVVSTQNYVLLYL